MAIKAVNTITLAKVSDGTDGKPGRTYMLEASTLVLKRSKDNSISPNFVEFKAFYRDGTSATRTSYAGRFKIEESVDGETWKTIYTSPANESYTKHSVYSALSTAAGQGIADAAGNVISVPRDVVSIRCTLYAAGGTTNALDIQGVTVVTDVDALSHEEIFNLLTNNGEIKGIYKEGNQLYISFTYARGGTLALGELNGKSVGKLEVWKSRTVNNSTVNSLIGEWDENGISVVGGSLVLDWPNPQGGYTKRFSVVEGTMESRDPVFIRNIKMKAYDDETERKIISMLTKSQMYIGGTSLSDHIGTIYIYADDLNITLPSGKTVFIGPKINTTQILCSKLSATGDANFSGKITAYQLSVSGSKSRIARTQNYTDRLLYCYETPSPMFGDIGEAELDETGICYVSMDDVFCETINTEMEYQVFLQKEGQGDIWVDLKEPAFFVVKGTPGLKFAWEVKARQKEYEYERLESFDNTEPTTEIDYEAEYIEEIEQIRKEREEILYGEAA